MASHSTRCRLLMASVEWARYAPSYRQSGSDRLAGGPF
jgi:hypothetical protein